MAKRHADDDSLDETSSRKGSSWLFWLGSRLFVVVLLLAVLLFFAPLLITSTGLWKTALAMAVPDVAPLVRVQSLELSWLAPVEIRGIAVADPSGQPLVEVPVVKSRRTLLALALNHRNVGAFDVEQPKVKVVLRRDGSNVEDLLAKLPKSESQGGGVGFILNVTKGTVELDDRIAGRQWAIENLDVAVASTVEQHATGKLAAAVRPLAGGGSGQVAMEFDVQPAADAKSLGTGLFKVALQGLPTELAEGALARFAGDIRPRGALTFSGTAGWQEGGKYQVQVEHVSSPALSVVAPNLLGTDQPTIAIALGQADIQLAGRQATVKRLDLQTSVVQIAGKGAAALGGLAADNVDLQAQINLAELSRQLPATLRLRQDMQLQSGTAEIALVTNAAAEARRFEGSLRTRDLKGIAAGRPIELAWPLEVSFAVRQTAQGPVIDKLVGEASFLHLEGRGSLAEGGVTAKADLDKLVAELGRLIDWGDTKLAGNVMTDIRWKQEPAAGWTANADVAVQNFEAAAPGLAPWKEPFLRCSASVRGDLSGASLAQVTAGKLTVEAGADRLDAELTESVRAPSAASVWPAKFTLRGDLASWTPRLQPFVALGGWRMAGGIDVAGLARVSAKEAEFAQTTLTLNQLAIDGPGVAVREPVIKVETAGAWSQPKSTLTLGTTTLASSAVAFRADGVRVALGKEPSLVGVIDFRGDLGRLSGWLASGTQPKTSQVAGGMTGRVEIGYRGQSLAANWNADIENLKLLAVQPPPASGWRTAWEEPRVSFAGQGSYDPAAGTLKIERTNLTSAHASLAAAGAVSKLTQAAEIDLTGEIAYDLAQVTQQLQARAAAGNAAAPGALPYGLETLALTGKQKRPFVLKGPLFAATGRLTPVGASQTTATGPLPSGGAPRGFGLSEALAGEASLGWEGAQYVGLVAGAADFRARLAGGIVNIGPLDIPLAEGRLTAAPRVLLNDPATTVVMERGPVLQNVRISPEMCGLWLKYVAPLVAEATRAEGKFTLTLEGANVPLSRPLASDVAGTLSIQSAQIGPGPLAQQYVGMARQVRGLLRNGTALGPADEADSGWVILPEQNVLFEVRNGTVLNRGLKMSVGEVVITTEGSVEIESQRINLVASVPLQDDWFKDKGGVFAVLKGQTLKIPVDGTLTQPRLDMRALQNIGKQMAGAAVQGAVTKQVERGQALLNKELERGQGALQNEISQGLNRLFGPKPATPAPQPR